MNVLLGCERSGVMRRAWRALGHNAHSCDLEPADDGDMHHVQADVLTVIELGCFVLDKKTFGTGHYEPWHIGIMCPPCTRLSLSGARWGTDHWVKRKNGEPRWYDGSKFRAERDEAVRFFIACIENKIPKVCAENPMSMASTLYRPKDQTIHPWQFGHPEFKTTWLWLKGLPALKPTNILTPPEKGTAEHAEWSKVHRMTPGPGRADARSRSYEGIAAAMAAQWGGGARIIAEGDY